MDEQQQQAQAQSVWDNVQSLFMKHCRRPHHAALRQSSVLDESCGTAMPPLQHGTHTTQRRRSNSAASHISTGDPVECTYNDGEHISTGGLLRHPCPASTRNVLERYDNQIVAFRAEVIHRRAAIAELDAAIRTVTNALREDNHGARAPTTVHDASVVSERLYPGPKASKGVIGHHDDAPPMRSLTNAEMMETANRLCPPSTSMHPIVDPAPLDRTVKGCWYFGSKDGPKHRGASAQPPPRFTDQTALRLGAADPGARRQRQTQRVENAMREARERCTTHAKASSIAATCARNYDAAAATQTHRDKAESATIHRINQSIRWAAAPLSADAVESSALRLSNESDAARRRREKSEAVYAHDYRPIGSVHAATITSVTAAHTFANLSKGTGYEWRRGAT